MAMTQSKEGPDLQHETWSFKDSCS